MSARRGAPRGDSDADSSTRQRVASSILEHGPSTAAALAERLDLTAAAIRRHLDVLTERGLIEAGEQRIYGARGRGRPAKVFSLTDVGRQEFYAEYDELAISALEYLREHAGPEAVAAFAGDRIAETERRYEAILAEAGPELTPAQALAAALSDDGYVAGTRPAGAGEQLCQHHCPVAHVAERFPELCEAETKAFGRLLGVHVQRLATIAHGDGVCTTHIPTSATGRGPSTKPVPGPVESPETATAVTERSH